MSILGSEREHTETRSSALQMQLTSFSLDMYLMGEIPEYRRREIKKVYVSDGGKTGKGEEAVRKEC